MTRTSRRRSCGAAPSSCSVGLSSVALILVLLLLPASAFITLRPPFSSSAAVAAPSSSSSSIIRRQASSSNPNSNSPTPWQGYSVYKPKGWDREWYRAPDDILFEWQELLCCLKFMEEKEVNAAMLAPETMEMMIGYAESIMARGSPVNTIEGLTEAMMGRWKLAFTTEERYKILPPATRIYYNIHRDGRLENVMKFKDKYWDSLVSTAKYTLTQQGRLLFEFTSNHVNVNNPFSKGSQFKLPLPQNVGNLGTAFADVSYMDGIMWIEKIRDQQSGQVYFSVYEYLGPIEGEERRPQSSSSSSSSSSPAPPLPPSSAPAASSTTPPSQRVSA